MLGKSHFVVTPVPNIASPLAALNNALDALKNPRVGTGTAKSAAVAACETARQACRHVEIAAKGHTSSWPTMPRYSTYAPGYSSAPVMPRSMVDEFDKSQLIALSKAGVRFE